MHEGARYEKVSRHGIDAVYIMHRLPTNHWILVHEITGCPWVYPLDPKDFSQESAFGGCKEVFQLIQ